MLVNIAAYYNATNNRNGYFIIDNDFGARTFYVIVQIYFITSVSYFTPIIMTDEQFQNSTQYQLYKIWTKYLPIKKLGLITKTIKELIYTINLTVKYLSVSLSTIKLSEVNKSRFDLVIRLIANSAYQWRYWEEHK